MLQTMLDLCYNEGVIFDLSFNTFKTVCGVFGMPCTQKLSKVTLSGSAVKWSDKMLYLGITFLFGLRLTIDL